MLPYNREDGDLTPLEFEREQRRKMKFKLQARVDIYPMPEPFESDEEISLLENNILIHGRNGGLLEARNVDNLQLISSHRLVQEGPFCFMKALTDNTDIQIYSSCEHPHQQMRHSILVNNGQLSTSVFDRRGLGVQIAFIPGKPNNFIIGRSSGEVRIFDGREDSRGIRLCHINQLVSTLTVHPLNEHYVCVGGTGNELKLYDTRLGLQAVREVSPIIQPKQIQDSPVCGVAINQIGETFMAWAGGSVWLGNDLRSIKPVSRANIEDAIRRGEIPTRKRKNSQPRSVVTIYDYLHSKNANDRYQGKIIEYLGCTPGVDEFSTIRRNQLAVSNDNVICLGNGGKAVVWSKNKVQPKQVISREAPITTLQFAGQTDDKDLAFLFRDGIETWSLSTTEGEL